VIQLGSIWAKVSGVLLAIVAIFFYRSKADRAEKELAENNAINSQEQKKAIHKANKALAEAQRKGKVKADEASKDIIPGFFTRRR